jgi:hypothetical protein
MASIQIECHSRFITALLRVIGASKLGIDGVKLGYK